jgi:AsmA protein
MKAVRYIVFTLIGLIVLAIAAVAIAVAVIDPNTYKPQIETAVESSTNLDLVLAGDIGWSFMPLGLELNDVEARLEDERLVRLDQLIARLSFWSLVTMSPQVHTFSLIGLEANLSVDESGTGNWTRIMPAGDAAATAEETAADSTEASSEESSPLNFNVEQIEISDARLHYEDKGTGQSLTLEGVSVIARQITLGSSFPLELAFRFATNQPQFEVDGSISAQLTANEALNDFSVTDLEASFDMAGEPFGGKSVRASLEGSLAANLENEMATLSDFTATLADLKLNTDLTVSGFGAEPQVTGSLGVEKFSLKALLSALGQPAIETEDPDVMKAVAFSTSIGGEPGTVALTDLSFTLDDTTFTGSAAYALANSGIQLDLKGDAINADRYLPPASDEEAASEEAPQGDQAAEEGDLLPLETLRSLALDINLGLGELIVSNLTINEIRSVITARDGVLKVEDFSGKLYDGSFGANVTLDARTDNPSWTIGSKVNSVKTLPLLTDLAEVEMLAGAANLNVDVKTTGNRLSALRSNARGGIDFNLAKGEFTRMNLTRMACQGIAMVNQEELSKSDWGASTPFNDMKGTLRIDGNTLNNTDLVAALSGMRLEGDGTVDLSASELDYEIGLRIVGEIARDEACRVTETVRDVVIPVECRGNFTEDPAGLCSFDGSRFRDTLTTIARNAAKAKAREEVDAARSKAEEKVSGKLQEKLGEQGGEQVKDALKGLFGQ